VDVWVGGGRPRCWRTLLMLHCAVLVIIVVARLCVCSYFSPRITPGLWSGFEAMCAGYLSFCPDYITSLVVPLDNMITRDPAGFLARATAGEGVSYLQLTWTIVERAFENRSESDGATAARVWQSVLINCGGSAVDEYMDAILARSARQLEVVKTAEGRVRVCASAAAAAALLRMMMMLLLPLAAAPTAAAVFFCVCA
jgi:hypothetical protein